jgi:uncharacterized protein YunC (DUF1805 family)
MACAVDHNSAEIGIAHDTWNCGIISHTCIQAKEAGIQVGDSVKEAVFKIINNTNLLSTRHEHMAAATPLPVEKESTTKADLKKQNQTQVEGQHITVTDSITFLNDHNAGDIVVCGSHGGVSAGHYAQKYAVKAVFFNDAGIGKNNAGTNGLVLLHDAGILACTVSCMSAEIFNGQDTLDNGVISVCNQLANARGIQEKMTVKEAIKFIEGFRGI